MTSRFHTVDYLARDIRRGVDPSPCRLARATPPTTTETYPAAGDWTRGRELTEAARPDVALTDPLQLTAGA